MKAYTSRARFDERRRFTAVREQMGRVRLDADANEQVVLVRTDARRRSGDLADGSPDDGFLVTGTHLLDPIYSTEGWGGQGLLPDDERVIPQELDLARRDPDTLPHVIRVRGYTQVLRTLPEPIDLLHLPIPLHPDGSTYQAAAVVLPVRFERPPTDDETVEVRVVLLDVNGDAHSVQTVETLSDQWSQVRVPMSALAALPRTALDDGSEALFIRGWGFQGLPPRAEVYFDALLAEDAGLGDGDFILRGGDGTLSRAGRLYVKGWRSFLEHDWRYSLQPHLRDPEPLQPPPDPDDWHYEAYLDLWERPVHAFQDSFLWEPALDGDDTTFRSQKVTQIRVRQVTSDTSEELPGPIGGGRLSTAIPAGSLPDRYPPEEPDPCRDRCLFSENVSTGEGYRGKENIHIRVEILHAGAPNPVVGWSRNNAATVAPLTVDAVAEAESVEVDPADAAHFMAGDIVVVEDEWSRLDPDRDENRCVLRRLRAVDTATGRMEFHTDGHLITNDPDALNVGGPLGRPFRSADRAAVRRWDGADWLLTGVRYRLTDGITFAFSGSDFRIAEYWSFTARIASSDGAARGMVQQLDDAPVDGPWHERVPLARISWTSEGRRIEDLRLQFLPLHEVRNRLIELGRRNLAPGAFTVVVGDGVRSFGDIDQNLSEGVTGDEALQAALDQLGHAGGTIYVRAGMYRLEHPVLVQARSDVRILGDGDASELRVTGAGGAFFLDWCGREGDVSIELLNLVESPEEETPIGAEALVGDLDAALLEAPGDTGGVGKAAPFSLSDLQASVPTMPDVITKFAQRVAAVRRGEGRAAASVVRTITRLRSLQRQNPGQPLEDIAAEELAVLRRLPHGVVTATDSSRVHLRRLNIATRERGSVSGIVAAGVLISGVCSEIDVSDCRVHAPSGIVVAAYGRFLAPLALVQRPRSGLFARSLTVSGNHVRSFGRSSFGVRIADGLLEGVTVTGNRIDGFPIGLSIEDHAEFRLGEAVDRTVVRDNQIVGATRVGIQVVGDGVDVEANEVRLAPGGESFRAGVQLTGVRNRLRDTWITLPAGPSPPALGLEAAIVVGSGQDAGGLVQRPVHDLEIACNRVEGVGARGFTCGILLGGSQPIYDVRIRGNTLRNLGDAGIRAWGHGGAVGRLQVEDNRIEGVARAYRSWGPSVTDEIARMVPAVSGSFGANTTPREVLETLLNQATGNVRRAIDGVLRWLESATLRGGVVFSLVEDSQVRDNHIVEVGSRVLPPNFVQPGAEIRTAGIAINGGRDLTVEDNHVNQVLGAIPSVTEEPPGPVPPRPPIFGFLDRLLLSPRLRKLAAEDLHGAIVALRRKLMAYAAGDSRQRQRLGGRIYAAMESVEAALESQGPRARRLARELSGGISEMQEAQGAEDHTRAANHVRATLSEAARLTADEPTIAGAWSTAARFDHVLLGEDQDIINVATEVIENAAGLMEGLEDIELDLASAAQAVIAAADNAASMRDAGLNLADALGMVAEARTRKVAFQRAIPKEGLGANQRTISEGMVHLLLASLGAEEPVSLNEEEIKRLEQGTAALADTLADMHRELAERLRQDFRAVRRTGGAPGTEAVEKLRQTLAQIREFAQSPEKGTTVNAADLQAQEYRFNAELVMLTAEQLDRRIGGLAVEAESSATRSLRLLKTAAGQLANLVEGEATLAAAAKDVEKAVSDAITDVDKRLQHKAAAQQKLRELQQEQGRIAGVVLRGGVEPTTGRVDVGRLAGLGQLLLELRGTRDDQLRREGAALFEEHMQSAVEEIDLRSSEREGIMRPTREAIESLVGGGAETEPAAWHLLAESLYRLIDHASREPAATRKTKAVRVLQGTLVRALDRTADETERLGSVRRWVETNRKALASSTANALHSAGSANAVLDAVFSGLAGLTQVRRAPILPVLVIPLFRPFPADGLFAAGVQAHLYLRGNHVESTRLGAAVARPGGHALAPIEEDYGISLVMEGNRVVGGAVGAIDLRVGPAADVSFLGNHLVECSGLAIPTSSEYGEAVVRIAGGGNLIVAGNRLHDNGTRQPRRLLHELMVDWRGDVTVQDNLVRHAGGGAGGAGLLVLSEDVEADLVRSLAQRPALEVEPPPERPEKDDGQEPDLDFNDFLVAGLGGQASLLRRKGSFGVAGFRLATLDPHPSFSRLEAARPSMPSVEVAESQASSWRDRVVAAIYHPIFEFLRRVPSRIIIPLPRARRAVHVANNDIVAGGPALLALADGSALVSATVVGNEFESGADTGAVYLRNTDTTVFAANRCECLSEINVVVIRNRPSLVSVTGNAVAGAQPPTPVHPPFEPFRPEVSRVGDMHLAFNLGGASVMTLKLDEVAVLAAIEKKKDTTFRNAVEEAEVTFNLFEKQSELTVDPQVKELLASGAAKRFFKLGEGESGPRLERISDDVAGQPEAGHGAEPPAATPEPTENAPAKEASGETVRLTLKTANIILNDPHLSIPAKLYGMARNAGYTAHQARNLVQTQLTATGGVKEAALVAGLRTLTGVAEVGPTVTERVEKSKLMEEVVGLVLRNKDLVSWKGEVLKPTPEPPPDPRDHSMVIIGGSRVGAINNVTTAGVCVHDAKQSIENNL